MNLKTEKNNRERDKELVLWEKKISNLANFKQADQRRKRHNFPTPEINTADIKSIIRE